MRKPWFGAVVPETDCGVLLNLIYLMEQFSYQLQHAEGQ